MNKLQLVGALREKLDLTWEEAHASVDTFVDVVTAELQKGEDVALTGFGKFYAVDRAARVARNPKTGESINVPAKRAVRFKVGSELARNVNTPSV